LNIQGETQKLPSTPLGLR